jgi:hypothetical protein
MMKLNVYIDENGFEVDVPEDMLADAKSIFDKMNRDMDGGWQMSREWVDELSSDQRCQVAADRLLTAYEQDNKPSMMLMAGYILTCIPEIKAVRIDTTGDMTQTEIIRN